MKYFALGLSLLFAGCALQPQSDTNHPVIHVADALFDNELFIQ